MSAHVDTLRATAAAYAAGDDHDTAAAFLEAAATELERLETLVAELGLDTADHVLVRHQIRAGQPRSYADHEHVYQYRLYARAVPAWPLTVRDGRMLMQDIEALYSKVPAKHERPNTMDGHYATYLDYMRYTDDTETAVEIRTATPYCD